MQISIMGCGYVGTITGAGLAELGNKVILTDVDQQKIDLLKASRSPVYEPGIEDILANNRERLNASLDIINSIRKSDITFICVGTPAHEDGSINLEYIRSAARSIGEAIERKDQDHLIIIKSTVTPGTAEEIVLPILEEFSKKRCGEGFSIAVNPEFLREGNAIGDFFNPDRIVLGATDDIAFNKLVSLYSGFSCPIIRTNLKTAELIKYASNAFLATKISFANEIGNYCKKLGINAEEVFQGVGYDHRINPAFFRSGVGFGGSCFPKDVIALIRAAECSGTEMRILRAALDVNDDQPRKIIDLLKLHFRSLQNVRIGILGLAFKPDTDDIRESRAIPVITQLIFEGANIIAYDPKANDNFKKLYPEIYYGSPDEVLDSDAVVILTEWNEFGDLDFTGKVVIDGRGIEEAKKNAKVYEGLCWNRK